MADYVTPMAKEMPDIEVAHVQTPTSESELGAKGAGESGTGAAPGVIMNAVNDLVQNRGITAQRQGLQYFGGHSCGGSTRLDNGTNFHKRRIPFSACYGGNGEGYLSSRIKMAEVAQCYPYLLRSPFLDQDALFLILHIGLSLIHI
mgnify:CR=1 FL=1